MRIHFAATLVVLLFNMMVRPQLGVVALDVAACTLVIGAELFNAAVESLADFATGGAWQRQAGAAKDAGAGAVLSIAAGAVAVGVYAGVSSWPWRWRFWSHVHFLGAVLSAAALVFWLWCVIAALHLSRKLRTVAEVPSDGAGPQER